MTMSHHARQAPSIVPELRGEQSACGSAVPTLLLLDKTSPGDGKGHGEGGARALAAAELPAPLQLPEVVPAPG